MSDVVCLCGHIESEHYHLGKAPKFCEKCFYVYPKSTKWQHIFKQDNLMLVEKLAQEKGLI